MHGVQPSYCCPSQTATKCWTWQVHRGTASRTNEWHGECAMPLHRAKRLMSRKCTESYGDIRRRSWNCCLALHADILCSEIPQSCGSDNVLTNHHYIIIKTSVPSGLGSKNILQIIYYPTVPCRIVSLVESICYPATLVEGF